MKVARITLGELLACRLGYRHRKVPGWVRSSQQRPYEPHGTGVAKGQTWKERTVTRDL